MFACDRVRLPGLKSAFSTKLHCITITNINKRGSDNVMFITFNIEMLRRRNSASESFINFALQSIPNFLSLCLARLCTQNV